jgi:hypothetical protein
MADEDRSIAWPSAFVAGVLILLVGGVTIAGIVRYPVDDALKVWGTLGSIVGLLTGSSVAYFFTRGTVDAANTAATTEQQKAETARRALTAVAGSVDQKAWRRLVRDVPEVRSAVTALI